MKRVLFVALLAVGCASSGVMRIGTSRPAPKPAGCVLPVYADPSEVGRPFERVCLIDVKTGGSRFEDRTPQGALAMARPLACQCGADAILVSDMETRTTVATQSRAHVAAIRFTGPPPNAEMLAASLAPGTRLYRGESLFGTVLGREKEHRFPDGRVVEALQVAMPAGGSGWLTLEEATKFQARME